MFVLTLPLFYRVQLKLVKLATMGEEEEVNFEYKRLCRPLKVFRNLHEFTVNSEMFLKFLKLIDSKRNFRRTF